MKLVLAEKPSVAQSIAKVLGATKREDGYLEGNGYVVSWCVGHLVELSQPEAYDEKYNKWAYPEMVLGELSMESTQYGKDDLTVRPREDMELADLLREAVTRIGGTYAPAELTEEANSQEKEQITIPARPDVKNFSYTVVDDEVYFRENSVMRLVELNDKAKERVSGMVELRRIVNELIEYQLEDYR